MHCHYNSSNNQTQLKNNNNNKSNKKYKTTTTTMTDVKMNNIQNVNKVIEKLKSNLCVFVCNDPNYDYVTNYIDNNQIENKSDHLENCVTPKLQTKSRTRLPIYYKTPTSDDKPIDSNTFNIASKSKIIQNKNNYYEDIDNVTTGLTAEPLHSTKLDNNVESPSILKFPYLYMTPDNDSKNKATSTMIYKILNTDYNDKNDNTPDISEIKITRRVASPSSCLASSSSSSSETSSEQDTTLKQMPINNKLFNLNEIGAIYACFIQYNAIYDGDLTIKFAERLKIIQDNGSYYLLVQNLSTKNYGYVPRDHITPVNTFLESLN